MRVSESTRRIALACGLGAFIGAMVSLEVGARFNIGDAVWMLGALVGGMVGYGAYDFRAFCRGVRTAGKETYHLARQTIPPFCSWVLAYVAFVACASVIGMSVILTAGALLGLAGAFGPADISVFLQGGIKVAAAIMAGLSALLGVGLLLPSDPPESLAAYAWGLVRQAGKTALLVNPVALPFTMLYLLWRTLLFLGRMAKEVPMVIVAILTGIAVVLVLLAMFAKKTFLYVHSSQRTICLVDAALGAIIGYSAGSPLIGAAAGAILGVLNYELISIRLLGFARRTV